MNAEHGFAVRLVQRKEAAQSTPDFPVREIRPADAP
jgi:hypothetical protein